MSVLAADPRVASLVEKIARRHCGAGVDINELTSAGMLAACQATERFDPARGSLTGFLRRRVEGAIIDAARRDCSSILTPRGCPPKRTVGDSQRDGQGDGQLSLADLISDHRGGLSVDVNTMVDELPDVEAEVIRRLWGLDDTTPVSADDLAALLGLTTTEVTAIHDRAFATLRRRFDDHDYHILSIEEPTMSRLNGFHAAEPTTASAEPSEGFFAYPPEKVYSSDQTARSGWTGIWSNSWMSAGKSMVSGALRNS
jgi:RNA polymerase sigma factor (sigma-70 family)